MGREAKRRSTEIEDMKKRNAQRHPNANDALSPAEKFIYGMQKWERGQRNNIAWGGKVYISNGHSLRNYNITVYEYRSSGPMKVIGTYNMREPGWQLKFLVAIGADMVPEITAVYVTMRLTGEPVRATEVINFKFEGEVDQIRFTERMVV